MGAERKSLAPGRPDADAVASYGPGQRLSNRIGKGCSLRPSVVSKTEAKKNGA
jgi:hypothetical protein